MLRKKTLILITALMLLFTSTQAQEVTEEAPLPTEIVLPSETPTEATAPTATPTETPTATLIPTDTPVLLETATQAAEVTTAVEVTAEVTTVPEVTPDVTLVTLQSETLTEIPTATSLPPEPLLGLLYSDDFLAGDTSLWTLDSGWTLTFGQSSFNLQVVNSDAPATFEGVLDLFNVVAEVRFTINAGEIRLNVRESAAGVYTASLDSGGLLRLYRSGQELGSALIGAVPAGTWRTLRLSTIEGVLRVAVDGTEIITVQDTLPLPAGKVSLAATVLSNILVSDFGLWIPQNELLARSIQGPTEAAFSAQLQSSPLMSPLTVESISRIAFYSNQTGNVDIYIMDADGGNVTRLTTHSGNDTHPTISPVGDKIAFVSNRDGNTEIYVMNIDGSAQTRVTNNSVVDSEPHWSPDGTKIAFTSIRSGLPNGIYTMNADGSNQQRLSGTTYTDFNPDWSPDGTKIAFRREGVPSESVRIYVMNASDGSNPQAITPNGFSSATPEWSPSGNQIAFMSHQAGRPNIYTMNADGSNIQQVTFTSLSTMVDLTPTWSPDGTQIAFTSTRQNINGPIYRTCATGDQNRPVVGLTPNPNYFTSFPDWSRTGTTPPIEGCDIIWTTDDLNAISLPEPGVSPELLVAADNFFSGDETSDEVNNVLLPMTALPGTCTTDDTDEARQICATYTYVAFYALFTEYTGRPPSAFDFISMVYNNELGLFGETPIAVQAVTRSFFDTQTGACRYTGTGYNCSYTNIVEFLGTVHSWYAQVTPIGGQAKVPLLDLLGVEQTYGQGQLDFDIFRRAARFSPDNIHLFTGATGGIFGYDAYVGSLIEANLSTWRSGQSPTDPSIWGNQNVTPNGTNNLANFAEYDPNAHWIVMFVHTFSDGDIKAEIHPNTINYENATNPSVICTYVTAIGSANEAGRLDELSTCP
jgi:TolB protein